MVLEVGLHDELPEEFDDEETKRQGDYDVPDEKAPASVGPDEGVIADEDDDEDDAA